MAPPSQDWLRLTRLATEPTGKARILPLVAEIAASQAGADAALVVLIEGDGARIAAAHGCKEATYDWELDPDALGPELEALILERCRAERRTYRYARSVPLISDAALFGALVVLYQTEANITPQSTELLSAVADIAATSLASAAHFERLERVNAELRATRAALQRTEKLRALGEMAAGVSHDLKNILNPLGLYLQLAKRLIATGDMQELGKSLDEMRGVVNRGTDLLERLRLFSRQAPEAPEQPVDLDALAREAIAIARPRASTGKKALPRVVEDLCGPPPVLARAGELVPAVVNLIANAQDALTDGGTITVRTGTERNGAFVEVHDTGAGMPEHVRERIFEPFFTTKGEQGTGLGLAMVYATMVRHGGTAEVESEEGRGTKVRLWFPSTREVRS